MITQVGNDKIEADVDPMYVIPADYWQIAIPLFVIPAGCWQVSRIPIMVLDSCLRRNDSERVFPDYSCRERPRQGISYSTGMTVLGDNHFGVP